MTEEWMRDVVHDKVDAVVEELLQAAGIEQPPVDAIVLAQRHLGMLVCIDRRQEQRGRAQRSGGRKQIFLRPEPSEERHQWTVAHEIGEHFKVQLLERLSLSPDQTRPMSGESLANLFAHRLLVPTCWFRDDAPGHDYDLLALKQRYRTASHAVIAWRFLDLTAPCIITILDNDQIHRRRSNAWPTRRRLEPAEVACQRYVNDYSRPQRVREGGWTVWGWPVHQADWKREVLRSVLDDVD